MPDVPPRSRPLRRDAQLNRQKILAAADQLFADRGLAVGHDEIARTAGVAVGTVYRRFPTKADLVTALFTAEVDRVVALARDAAGQSDPWNALVTFMTEVMRMHVNSRGLRELNLGSKHGRELSEYARSNISPVVRRLVRRGQRAGVVRADVREEDVAVIPVMIDPVIAATRHVRGEYWRRPLAILLDGFRPGSYDRLPAPPMTTSEVAHMIGD